MKSCPLFFRSLRFLLPLALFAGTILLHKASHADQALVVGVNEYPRLRPDSALGGCANDANRMAAALKKYHFTVTVLTNAKATHSDIMNALGKFKSIGAGERFVFYFAGHGTHASNGESVLLPSDAEDGNETRDIRHDELFAALKAIPAKSRTALLDSCFSGGMMHTRAIHELSGLNLKSRYYQRNAVRKELRVNGKSFEEVPINKQDEVDDDRNQVAGVCYYAACMKNEVSYEMMQANGNTGGVFTTHLTELLTGDRDIWSNLSAVISQKVAQDTGDLQRPVISPAYLPKIVFEDTNGTDKRKNTLADIYYTSNPDPAQVSLKMSPDISPLLLKQEVHFEVEAGGDGYMIVLGRDANDEIYVVSPFNGKGEPIKVSAGTTIRIPTDVKLNLRAKDLGTERIKAILFKDRAAADKMLAAIREASGVKDGSKRAALSRKFQEVPIDDAPFYTAELMVEVVPAQ